MKPRMLTHCAALLLDLDGTLIDSGDYWFQVVSEASAAFGGRSVARAAFDATFGQPASADVEEFFPGARLEDVDAFYEAALPRHGHRIRVARGAWELLSRALERDVARACVTNCAAGFTRGVLQATGLWPWMNAVACVDQVPRAKPAPDLLHLAAARLAVPVQQCVLVGDSRYDVAAARAAGCRVLGIGVEADETVGSLADVAEQLGARTWNPRN